MVSTFSYIDATVTTPAERRRSSATLAKRYRAPAPRKRGMPASAAAMSSPGFTANELEPAPSTFSRAVESAAIWQRKASSKAARSANSSAGTAKGSAGTSTAGTASEGVEAGAAATPACVPGSQGMPFTPLRDPCEESCSHSSCHIIQKNSESGMRASR